MAEDFYANTVPRSHLAQAIRDRDQYRAERDLYREALEQAVAEIEGSPWASEPWGYGIAFRLPEWKLLLAPEDGNDG